VGKKRKSRITRTTTQRKIIIGLMVYLGCLVLIAGWFGWQQYRAPVVSPVAGEEPVSPADFNLLDSLMQEVAEIRSSPGSTTENPSGLEPGLPGLYPGLPPSGNGSGSGAEAPGGVSSDRLSRLRDQVSVADRVRVVNILRQRLSKDDVRQIVAWMQGGITAGERTAIKNLLTLRLTADEMQELNQLYEKYR